MELCHEGPCVKEFGLHPVDTEVTEALEAVECGGVVVRFTF